MPLSKITKTHWQPSASWQVLQFRAHIMHNIRQFFSKRQITEVSTPLLGLSTATDPHLHSLFTKTAPHTLPLYLQTSPEYAMKRLLAAYEQPIYQLCKAFRADETGPYHQPEFTILEWYRPGWNLNQLKNEVETLTHEILQHPPCHQTTYQHLFQQHLAINPHQCSLDELKTCATQQDISLSDETLHSLSMNNKDPWLDLLFSHCIQPQLGHKHPIFVTDYPKTQATLVQLKPATQDHPELALRFELFINGLEIANGCEELTDAHEQRCRFQADNQIRTTLNKPSIPLDEALLTAIAHLKPCSGVALGVDRLIWLRARQLFPLDQLTEILAFPTPHPLYA